MLVFDMVFQAWAKDGFDVAIRIIPSLVGILAIGTFRGSGAIDLLMADLQPIVAPIGFPPEIPSMPKAIGGAARDLEMRLSSSEGL